MKLNHIIIEELSHIPWLVNCGKNPPTFDFTTYQVANWIDVQNHLLEGWLDQTEDAQGNLTEYLSSHHPSSYQGIWNNLVREATPYIEKSIEGKLNNLATESGLGKKLIESIKWDVLSAIMEESYKSCKPPIFFNKLMSIYRSGHFPCGMREDGAIYLY